MSSLLLLGLPCLPITAWAQQTYEVFPVFGFRDGTDPKDRTWRETAFVLNKPDSKIWHCDVIFHFNRGPYSKEGTPWSGYCINLSTTINLTLNQNSQIKQSMWPAPPAKDDTMNALYSFWVIDQSNGTLQFCKFSMGWKPCFQFAPLPLPGEGYR
jgi:hypothetical protein